MKIYNTTTGKIEELRHASYSSDCVPDLVASDDGIEWSKEQERYEACEGTISWWQDYLAADAEYLAAKKELMRALDEDDAEELEQQLYCAMLCDMGDQPAAGMRVIEGWKNR